MISLITLASCYHRMWSNRLRILFMTCYLTVPSTSESRIDGRQTYRDVMQKTIETSLVFWHTKCRQQDVVVRDRRSLDILNSQQHLQEIHVHQLYANI